MLRPDQLLLLADLPNHWRYVPTGNDGSAKRSIIPGWNLKGNGQKLEEILRLSNDPKPEERWKSRKLIGVGVITGEESNGLLVVDFDGKGTQAVRAFVKHFRHLPSELPKTVVNVSGKRGRAKAYFNVPPSFWPQLEGRSASWRDSAGNVILEAIWQNRTGTGRHAVICGDHPDSSDAHPLYYRWATGCSPSEVQVAEAPEWLLLGVLAKCEETNASEPSVQEKLRAGDDDATPWERLTVEERVELTREALEHCPNRTGRGSGTYEKTRRILCGLLNEFGMDLAGHIVAESVWDTRNEWDQGMDGRKMLASLAKSRVSEDSKARIASMFFFARENGWEPPSWAQPPVEVKQQVDGIKKLLNLMIRDSDDRVAQAAYLGRGQREFGIAPELMRKLALEQYLGVSASHQALTLKQVRELSKANSNDTDVINGFLGRRVHVVAGASHSGKTTLACFLANRVITGQPFDVDAIRHSAPRSGKVLVLTSDCSDADMVRDLALEGVDIESADDRVRIVSGITYNDMLLIVKLLEDYAPDLVVHDCLTSMACDGVKIGDPAYADPIRFLVRHNGVSWPKCSHLILHHTTRDEPTRFSGTEQIKAATEELWLYYPPELMKWKKGQPKPQVGPTRSLVMEKSRTGYGGRTFTVTRNAYQGYWQIHRPLAENETPLEALTRSFRLITHDDWKIASEWQRELDIAFHPRSFRRYLDQLVGPVLESKKLRSSRTGRLDTHYRPLEVLRDGAKAMVSSRGDGINVI